MNLLNETLDILKEHNHFPADVLWVGCPEFRTSWENFAKIADVEYDSGWGAPEVAEDLIVEGKTFWLERASYDGSEWWEYRSKARPEPQIVRELVAVTVGQGSALGFGCSCGWESLAVINGLRSRWGDE